MNIAYFIEKQELIIIPAFLIGKRASGSGNQQHLTPFTKI